MQYLNDKKETDAVFFEEIARAGVTAMQANVESAMKIFGSDGCF